MKLSYGITVCNELNEIKNLISFLKDNIHKDDEIVVLFDSMNGSYEVRDFLKTLSLDCKIYMDSKFNNNFSDWKNLLNSKCDGDYILQLDADEMIPKILIKNLRLIIETNPNVDLFLLPRINIVDGITDDDISKWNWYVNSKGWINWPDQQGRLYKKGMIWGGRVHERISNFKTVSGFPLEENFAIIHNKDIERQRRQNNYYRSI